MRQNTWECNAKTREELVDRGFTTEQLQGGRAVTASICVPSHRSVCGLQCLVHEWSNWSGIRVFFGPNFTTGLTSENVKVCCKVGAKVHECGLLRDMLCQTQKISSLRRQHFKSDKCNRWKVGKGLRTGTQTTVLWISSSTANTGTQFSTTSVTNENDNQFGLWGPWCSFVPSCFKQLNCGCTVLWTISAEPLNSCSEGEAPRNDLSHYPIRKCFSSISGHC